MMGDSVSENNGKPQEESESLQNLGCLIGAGTALEDIVNEHKKKETTDRKRVIYARRPDGGKNPELGYTIDEGEPIDVETACDLKKICWGGADRPIKENWTKQGIYFNPAEKLLSYGLKTEKNETKTLLMCLQAYLLKPLLFAENEKENKRTANRGKYNRTKKDKEDKVDKLLSDDAVAKILKCKEATQKNMLIEGITEMLFKASGGKDAVFCLTGDTACFEPPNSFLNDAITEKLRLFTTKNPNDLKPIIKTFLDLITKENGVGLICILYSLILSRGIELIKTDLQDQADKPLVNMELNECSQGLINLSIAGIATPYVHNSSTMIGDKQRDGICGRCEIGLLMSSGDSQSEQVGAYLKTPILPMWLTKCDGQLGILFNPNKDIFRNKAAENKFELYYYANFEFGKSEKPKETILTIDSRNGAKKDDSDKGFDPTVVKIPPLETAIHTKWQDSTIDWKDVEPYVW